MSFPKRKKGIDDPVVLVHEECVDRCEGRLYDSSGVPACQVVWSWVGFWDPLTLMWATETTLTSRWQGTSAFAVPIVLSLQSSSWYVGSFAIYPRYRNGFPQSNGRLIVGTIDIAAVDESCDPVYLLSWLPLLWTEDIGPDN